MANLIIRCGKLTITDLRGFPPRPRCIATPYSLLPTPYSLLFKT
ncbi:hypothetical protein [Moorena producens]|nr:hypothetical protein [Moorena producens]